MNQPEVSFPHMLKYGLISMYARKKRDSVLPMKSKGSIYEEKLHSRLEFEQKHGMVINKGQYILNQNCWAITSPKKQTHEFDSYPDSPAILITWISIQDLLTFSFHKKIRDQKHYNHIFYNSSIQPVVNHR